MKDQVDGERKIGLISQEVQKVFPSLTHLVPGQDILALSYTELIPVLIKAIQGQQILIDSQQTTIKNQDSKIDDLTADFNQRILHIERILKTSQ